MFSTKFRKNSIPSKWSNFHVRKLSMLSRIHEVSFPFRYRYNFYACSVYFTHKKKEMVRILTICTNNLFILHWIFEWPWIREIGVDWFFNSKPTRRYTRIAYFDRDRFSLHVDTLWRRDEKSKVTRVKWYTMYTSRLSFLCNLWIFFEIIETGSVSQRKKRRVSASLMQITVYDVFLGYLCRSRPPWRHVFFIDLVHWQLGRRQFCFT